MDSRKDIEGDWRLPTADQEDSERQIDCKEWDQQTKQIRLNLDYEEAQVHHANLRTRGCSFLRNYKAEKSGCKSNALKAYATPTQQASIAAILKDKIKNSKTVFFLRGCHKTQEVMIQILSTGNRFYPYPSSTLDPVSIASSAGHRGFLVQKDSQ